MFLCIESVVLMLKTPPLIWIIWRKMIIENCDKKENIYVFDFINVTIKGQKINNSKPLISWGKVYLQNVYSTWISTLTDFGSNVSLVSSVFSLSGFSVTGTFSFSFSWEFSGWLFENSFISRFSEDSSSSSGGIF